MFHSADRDELEQFDPDQDNLDLDLFMDEDDSDYEDDGQPDEYTEWQDLYGGDDWDYGQCDCDDY